MPWSPVADGRGARWSDMGQRDSHDEVTDDDLRDEIELLGDVITAVMGCPGHLSAAEVDLALGVGRPEARPDVEAEVAH